MTLTREQINAALDTVDGAPDTGIVHDLRPGYVAALLAAQEPVGTDTDKRTKRVVEATETR